MKIDFINSNYQRFYKKNKKAIDKAVLGCLAKGNLTLRKNVWDLEKNIAKFVGTKYCASVASGTDALFLSLKALGIGRGDSVIAVSNTFIATIQAIVHTGAEPILIDVGEDELMNVDLLESAIRADTKAIIPVQYTGAVCNMAIILLIAEKYKLHVIDDYCQALGATYQFPVWDRREEIATKIHFREIGENNVKVGSMGILNAVSFNTAKLLGGLCDGGAVTTNNRELYEKICLLRNHWNVHQLSVDRKDYPQPKEMDWGWKSRLSNVNAAFLNVKFKTIKSILKRRKQIAEKYRKEFYMIEAYQPNGFELPYRQEGRIWQEFHLKVKDREKFAEFLKKKGIETLTRDVVPNHKMPGLGLSHYELPVTEQLAKEVIRLPLHENLTNNEVAYIIKCVKEYYK